MKFMCLLLSILFVVNAATDEKLQSLLSWSSAKGIQLKKAEVAEVPGFKYGIRATHKIQVGEQILFVPYKAMLMTSTSDLTELFEEKKFTPTNQLMLSLLVETKKPNSIFKPYIDIFPSKFWTSLYFNYDESKTLQKSRLREESVYKREGLEILYDTSIKPLLSSHNHYFDRINTSLDKVLWAISVVWSRANLLEDKHELALIPIADFFNDPTTVVPSSTTVKVKVQYKPNGIEFVATGVIQPGDPIYSPFSMKRRMGNSVLLQDWGFTVEGNANNVVYLENPIKPDQPFYTQKRDLLMKNNLWMEYYPIYRGEYDSIYSLARVYSLTVADLPSAQKVFAGQLHKKNEKSALRKLHTWITNLLDSYPTSMIDDKALQYELGISDNIRNSIIVRKGEKEILYDLKNKLEGAKVLMPDHDEL